MRRPELLMSRAWWGCRPRWRPGRPVQHCRPDVGSGNAPCRWGRGGGDKEGRGCLVCCSLLSSISGLHLLKARSTPLGHDNQQRLPTRPSVPPGHSQPPALQRTTPAEKAVSRAQSQHRVSELGEPLLHPPDVLPPPMLLP